jgi:DNA-binding beta-propeller fold protein YncE
LAVAPDGRVAVAEATTASVLIFNPDGVLAYAIQQILIEPSDTAFTATGELLVADARQGILSIDAQGNIQWTMAKVSSPRGVAVAPDGTIFVADTGGQRILQLNPAGEIIKEFRGEKRLGQPTGVAVSPTGLIAVGDPAAAAVFILSPADQVLLTILITAGADTSDRKPAVLWLNETTLLYTDATAGQMFLIDQTGTVIKEWSGLKRPNDLAIGPDNQLYLLEAGANRVAPMPLPAP